MSIQQKKISVQKRSPNFNKEGIVMCKHCLKIVGKEDINNGTEVHSIDYKVSVSKEGVKFEQLKVYTKPKSGGK